MSVATLLRRRGVVTVALFGFYPLWWALGFGELIWPLAGLAMLISLVQVKAVSVPRWGSIWVLFLVAVAASGFMLEEERDVYSWMIRFAQYGAAGLIIPYVLTHRRSIPPRYLFASMTALFAASIAGGYLGLLLGDFSFRSALGYVMPAGFQANEFVAEVVNPSFADIERFLGRFAVVRPKAPFTYTNGWGAAVGLLAPFALHDAIAGYGLSKKIARVALIASTVPIAMSLNQGLWISLVAGGGYATMRSFGRGDLRLLLKVAVAAFIVAIAIIATPLGDAFRGELQNPNATEDRLELYQATLRSMPESPVLGFGGPRQIEDGGPPAGTHGQLWVVLFSHGILGATAYFGFLAGMLWKTHRYRTNTGLWCHTVIFVSFVQAPFYGHVPQQLGIIMVAAAVGLLDAAGQSDEGSGAAQASDSSSEPRAPNARMAAP